MALAQSSRSEAYPEDPEDAGRRRSARHPSEASLTVAVDAAQLAGRAENLSEHGVFLFTAQGISVTVETLDHGAVRRRTGKLVRVQRMSEAELGLAIEFDR